MKPSSLGLSLRQDAVDHPMHLKARLVVLLQQELLKQSQTPLAALAAMLHVSQEVLSNLLVLRTEGVTLSDLRQFLLVLGVPMQNIERCLLT